MHLDRSDLPQAYPLSVHFFPEDASKISDVKVTSSDPFLSAHLVNEDRPKGLYQYEVVLSDQAPCGEIDTFVQILATINGKIISRNLPIAGVIHGQYAATPATVFISTKEGLAVRTIKINGPLSGIRPTVRVVANGFPADYLTTEFDQDSNEVHMTLNTQKIEHNSSGTLYIENGIEHDLLSIPFYVSTGNPFE
jgi:hypothetical protein